MQRRLLFLLPLLTLALMASFFAWSLLAGRDPAAIGSVLVGRPAPRLDLPALRPGDPPLTDALLKTGKPVLVNNAVSLWAGMRLLKRNDSIPGYGRLLRDHLAT